MASNCPRCGSDILPGEVSPAPGGDEGQPTAEPTEAARCLCCGSALRRPVGAETWELSGSLEG